MIFEKYAKLKYKYGTNISGVVGIKGWIYVNTLDKKKWKGFAAFLSSST